MAAANDRRVATIRPEASRIPDLFHQVLKKLGVTEPERVLAVGDTPYDALAAKPLGLRAADVLTGGFSSKELKAAGCDAVLAEIKDLASYLARIGD
jgi:phosphoglycolate phosphatase-like HAD superfamily hydrolase